MTATRPGACLAPAAVLFAAACGGERASERAAASEPARVTILAPAEGDTVDLPFTVRLAAAGVAVVPASGLRQAGEGHHHLLIDLDLPASDQPIPVGPFSIHIGTGASERVIDSLPPGPHRIIAVLGWGDHVPAGIITDTIHIVVR